MKGKKADRRKGRARQKGAPKAKRRVHFTDAGDPAETRANQVSSHQDAAAIPSTLPTGIPPGTRWVSISSLDQRYTAAAPQPTPIRRAFGKDEWLAAMGADSTYVKSVQEEIDLEICRREPGTIDGFEALWWIHHQTAHEVARISLKLGSLPEDAKSLLRRYYGTMSGIVMKEMVKKNMNCASARAAVSAHMLRAAKEIRDPVKVECCRGAALLLMDAGDQWVAKEPSALEGASIGGRQVWEARLRKVKVALNAACKKRSRPHDISVLFGKYFSKLVSDASSRSVKETLPWSTAKKNEIESTFARNFPADPVRTAAYTSAALLLGVVPDDSSPGDQLRYATLYTSCLDASRPGSRTVAAPTVAGLKMAAAAAGSTPEQLEGMVPIQVGGFQTPPADKVGSTPFKVPVEAQASRATAGDVGPLPAQIMIQPRIEYPDDSAKEGDLGPNADRTKNAKWPAALAEKSTLTPAPLATDCKSTPATSGAGVDARSKSQQHSGWKEAITSTPSETLVPPLFEMEIAAEVSTTIDVSNASLGAGRQSYGRSESTEDFGIAVSKVTAKHAINEFYSAAPASAKSTPPTVNVSGMAQTAGGPVKAQKVPRIRPQGVPVSGCGASAKANPQQKAPAVLGTAGAAAAGLGAASTPPALSAPRENTDSFGFDTATSKSSVPSKAGGESTTSTEVGAGAAANFKPVGAQSMPVSATKPSRPTVPGTTSVALGTASIPPDLQGPRPSTGPIKISQSVFDNSLPFQTTGKPASKTEAGVVAGVGLKSVGAATKTTASGAGNMPPPTPGRPLRGMEHQSHRPQGVPALAHGTIERVILPLEAPDEMRASPAEAASVAAAAVAAAVAEASAEAALGTGRMAAQAPREDPVPGPTTGVGVGTAPTPTGDALRPGTPTTSTAAAPGLREPGQNRAFDPQAPPLDAAQAAVRGADPQACSEREASAVRDRVVSGMEPGTSSHVGLPPGLPTRPSDADAFGAGALRVGGSKQSTVKAASEWAMAYPHWFAKATAAGFGTGASPCATRPPHDETRRVLPALGTPITAETGSSMGSGLGGGCSPNKRKVGSLDGDDSTGGANKKACNVSIAGDVGNVSTYSGGSAGGPCNKRKDRNNDGCGPSERPTKVCCV